jgi:hypothetical protein
MRRRPVQILAILLLATAVLAAAGCGGKKSASSTTTTTTTTTSTETTSTTESTATDTTATDTTTTTTTTTAGTDTSSSAAIAALATSGNCKSLADLGAAFSSAFTGANGDLQKQADLFQQLVDKAPDQIKPDLQVIADDWAKIAAALKGVDLSSGKTPDPAALAKIAALQSTIDQQKLTAAEQHLNAWATANCHG